MTGPEGLEAADLQPFEPQLANGDFDRDEPLEITATRIAADDMQVLGTVPFAADGCLFENCDLSVSAVVGIKNSRLVSCKLRGTQFSKYVRNVVFDGCQLIECSFRMMSLEVVTFRSCQLAKNDFYESKLERVSMPKSQFSGVGFDRSALHHVDLTGASDLQIGDPRTLRGAVLCETQVPLIAARLAELTGIVVQDC